MKTSASIVAVAMGLALGGCGTTAKEQKLESQLRSEREELQRIKTEDLTRMDRLQEAKQAIEANLQDELAKRQATISELQGKLTLSVVEDVLFDSGSAVLHPEGKAILDKVAAALKNLKGDTIMIEGHTDNVPIAPPLQPTYPTNWELSTARATTVVRYLQDQGVSPDILGAAGFSKYRPIASNDTDQGRHDNRRIDVVLTPVFKETRTELSTSQPQ